MKYRVQLSAGPYSWTVTDDDAPTFGLMDPLVIGWSLPDDAQRPAQPDPMVAQFSLVVASAADVAELGIGSLVTIAVTFGGVTKPVPDVGFIGRIAQGDAAAHPRGMLYRFTCADLTTDLLGYDIGATPYPVQSVNARSAGYRTAAGLPSSDWMVNPSVAALSDQLLVEAMDDPAAANLLESSVALFDQVAYPGMGALAGSVFYRAILAPAPGTSSLGIPWRWAIDAVPDTYVPTAASPLPGQFGAYFPAPKAYGVYFDPDDRNAGVLDACFIDYDAPWVAIQPAVINRAAVRWWRAPDAASDRIPRATYTLENPPPAGQSPNTATRQTDIVAFTATPATETAAADNATNLGHMMVPPPQNKAGWGPDTFRWLLYADEVGLARFPTIFPAHYATAQPTPQPQRTACYVRPIVVVDVPGETNPADPSRVWVGGQLVNVQLTIEAGQPVVEFTLTPTIPTAGDPGTGVNSWDSTAGTWNAQAGEWNDLVPGYPSFRWSDVGLAGVTWNQLYPQPWDAYRLARGTA